MLRTTYALLEEKNGGHRSSFEMGEGQEMVIKKREYLCEAENEGLMGGRRSGKKVYSPPQPVFGTFPL